MSAQRSLLALLALGILAYPLVSPGPARDVCYDVVGVACVALAFAALRRRRPLRGRSWNLVLGGYLAWVAGDLVYSAEQDLWHLDLLPAPSDGLYLTAYALLVLGLLGMVRGRRTGRGLAPVLDAAIVATGWAVLVGVFVVAPISRDSSLGVAGRVTASMYPVVDVLLIAILVRIWTSPGARTAAFRLLVASLAMMLAADASWNVLALVGQGRSVPAWNDMLYLSSYLALALAVQHGSMHALAEPAADVEASGDPQRRILALASGLVLPGVALALDGLLHRQVSWLVVAVGSVVLSLLVLARLATLLHVVSVQAVRLAALARADALTGAPNRRTWDHELGRACRAAREHGQPLTVAIVDLDHFASFNHRHGHQAGDRLLREAVAAWTELLVRGELLARYGGEEFALLLPGATTTEAATRLDELRRRTPKGQTFSAGVAAWDPASEPAAVVAAADRALFDAKRAGRDRVFVAQGSRRDPALPALRIVLQPIVDLEDGSVVGHEALSRFDGQDPPTAFATAYRAGCGPELEAAALAAALRHRPGSGLLSLNVSVDALTSAAVLDALPDDLTGLMLEVTEHTDADSWQRLDEVVADLRERGAKIAIDDWGQGYSNLDRLLRLRPDVLKLDMSLVRALDSDLHAAAVRSIGELARGAGMTVCAEGVETEWQRRRLCELGIRLGQGYLFGRPVAPEPRQVSPASEAWEAWQVPA